MDYLQILRGSDYDFLRTDPHLGNNLMFLTLGGSHAYGTNVEGSDLDIRGCAFNTKEELLLQNPFEQVINKATDTTIYGFNKLIKLLTNCNPNVIELLGLPEEYYFHLTQLGKMMLDNKDMFLSKRAVQTFGGYAYAQLRRLDNKAVRRTSQADYEQHILNSINTAKDTFKERYLSFDDNLKLYLGDNLETKEEKDIFMDITLKHYPLNDYLILIYGAIASRLNRRRACVFHLIKAEMNNIDMKIIDELRLEAKNNKVLSSIISSVSKNSFGDKTD
jgi:predicted nucleotidyltransferase